MTKSNELTNAIFNTNYEYELYKEMAEKINNIEWYFRTFTRKHLHSDWKVFRRKSRQWITRAGDLLKNKSYTEHFVYHFFKKHISKYHSLYSLKNIKTIIIYQNLKKNYATIFR